MKRKVFTYFDRFDICEAYYLFASHYHDGQWSETYKIFGRLNNIQFRPSPMLSLKSLTKNSLRIYANLKYNELQAGK